MPSQPLRCWLRMLASLHERSGSRLPESARCAALSVLC